MKFAGGMTQFAARDPFTLADLKEAWRHGLLWRPPSLNRIIRMIGLTLVFLGFCFAQFSLDAAAAKGYAIVLLLSGAVWLVTRLEPISQIPQQDYATAEMEHPEKVLSVSFVPDNQPPEVLKPGKQSFNLPTSAVSSQAPTVLCSVDSVAAVRSDQLDPETLQFCVQFVGVIGFVADEIPRSIRDYHLDERGDNQLDFVGVALSTHTATGRPLRSATAIILVPLPRFVFTTFEPLFLPGRSSHQ